MERKAPVLPRDICVSSFMGCGFNWEGGLGDVEEHFVVVVEPELRKCSHIVVCNDLLESESKAMARLGKKIN